jgi:hypothetical protein
MPPDTTGEPLAYPRPRPNPEWLLGDPVNELALVDRPPPQCCNAARRSGGRQ